MISPAASLRTLRWLLIAVIMAGRLVAPAMSMTMSMPMAPPAGLAGLLDAGAICHAVPDDTDTPAPKPAQHSHECGLCPSCHIVQASVLPALGPTPPMPQPGAIRRVLAPPPPATAPPSSAWTPSRPRGPPTLRI